MSIILSHKLLDRVKEGMDSRESILFDVISPIIIEKLKDFASSPLGFRIRY